MVRLHCAEFHYALPHRVRLTVREAELEDSRPVIAEMQQKGAQVETSYLLCQPQSRSKPCPLCRPQCVACLHLHGRSNTARFVARFQARLTNRVSTQVSMWRSWCLLRRPDRASRPWTS